MSIPRREFLAGAAALAGGSLIGTSALAATSKGADSLRIAVIGVRGRGKGHLAAYGERVAAICDCDRTVLDERTATHAAQYGREVAKYVDYRALLEKADIDGVSIVTPNHTHSLIAIAALEAGKHVYVEKPVSHNVWEGRQLVAAAEKHDHLFVQAGTQSRSSPALREAVAWVQGGAMGDVRYALGTCYKPRKPIGKRDEPLPLPEGVDYDLWCGPAEKRNLFRNQLHYDWHWDWNTGNGDMGNQGIHQMDIARWFLGETGMAPRTRSIGGRLGYEDAGDTPNTQVVYHDYAKAPLIFETRGLPRSKAGQRNWGKNMDRYRGSGIGVIVQCDGGHVLIPDYSSAFAFDREGKLVRQWSQGANHFENWLDAIAAGDKSLLNGPIVEGHVSSSLCHVGGASHLAGAEAVVDEIALTINGDPLFSAAFDRMAAHLRANDVDVDSKPGALTLGPWVGVDPETERFSGAPAAEAVFRRDGRAPFAITDYGA